MCQYQENLQVGKYVRLNIDVQVHMLQAHEILRSREECLDFLLDVG